MHYTHISIVIIRQKTDLNGKLIFFSFTEYIFTTDSYQKMYTSIKIILKIILLSYDFKEILIFRSYFDFFKTFFYILMAFLNTTLYFMC